MRYVLAPREVGARARVVALSGAAVAVAPAWLVIVLVAKLGIAPRGVTTGLAGAVGLLGLARALLEQRRVRRRLGALAVVFEGDDLTLSTERGETHVPAAAIRRVTEIDGAYGGLRLELAGPGLPPRFDVPRGGDAFADLRGWLVDRAPLARTPRRSRAARIALAAAIVLGLFFVPFVVADARGSRLAVALVLLVAWGAMRAAAKR